MKKFTLAIIVALAASLAVAQGPGGRPGGGPGGPGGPGGGRGRMDPKAMTEMISKQLSLTPAQKKRVMELQTARMADMDKLRKAPGDRNSKRPQMQKLRELYDGKMKKALTKEQGVKYDKWQAEMRARFGGGRGGPGGRMGGPGGRPPGPGGPGGPPKGGA
jgi:Spy/CpxP family protein refolding chaperone